MLLFKSLQDEIKNIFKKKLFLVTFDLPTRIDASINQLIIIIMSKENLILKLNVENEVEFKLINSRELLSEEKVIIDGKEKIKRKYRVFYDRNINYKNFKNKILKLRKLEGKIVIYGFKKGELKMLDYIKWNENLMDLIFKKKKEIKDGNENLEMFENRFEWFEDLVKNKGYKKIKLIPVF